MFHFRLEPKNIRFTGSRIVSSRPPAVPSPSLGFSRKLPPEFAPELPTLIQFPYLLQVKFEPVTAFAYARWLKVRGIRVERKFSDQ